MKFLKFRYIFTLAIVLVIGITLMVYFLGGLSATALGDSNMEFSYEGYLDYSEYDADGNRYVVYETELEMDNAVKDLDPSTYEKNSANNIYIVKYKLNSAKIVAQNEKYTMFLDEKTTIVTVGVNDSYKLATPLDKTSEGFINYDLAQFEVTYDSAVKTDNTGPGRSNLLLRYVGSNAKESSITFNTFANSVSYEDLLLGQKQRHYKIKFDIENGIEILYEIGDFTVYETFFPKKIDRNHFFEYFRGNLVFVVNSTSILNNNTLEYSNLAYTWSKECADYLESNELATVTPNYSGATALDENGDLIPTRYDLTDILEIKLDEDGNEVLDPITKLPKTTNILKLKAGVDFNPVDANVEGASPCITNPFANSFTLESLFVNYYILQQRDENDPDITYTTGWRFNTENLSPTFTRRATGALQNTKMYEFMYKMNTQLDPNYLYENATQVTITQANYANYVDQYPGINIGDRLIIKTPVSYYEDLSRVFYGYLNQGKFYEDTAFKVEVNTSLYDDFVDKRNYRSYVLEDGEFVRTDKSIPVGGYQAKDENGNFLYNEDGTPVQDVYTVDLANAQNEQYGIESEATPPIFQIAMRFVLTDEGMKTTILDNSVLEGLGKDYVDAEGKRTKYSHDLKISRFEVLPYFTTNADSNSKGQIIIPDGSGAIINFNSPKAALGYPATEKRIYGPDKAFTFDRSQENSYNEKLMFGMYGFLDQTNRKGVLAIVDQGASQSSIYANFKRNTPTSRNFAYFTAIMREREEVYVGSSRTAFTKWSQARSTTDFSYIYQFLDESEFVDENNNIEYVTLAGKYRDYLIDKYDLQEKKDTTKHNVLALNFLGAFEKREVSFGIAHNVEYSLTTFDQARNIIEELQAEGVNGFSVAYTGWTRDAMEPRATNNVKVSKVLGDAKGIRSFKQFLEENEINLYPEVRITSNKGYDYSFGNMKYTAKGVGSTYAQHREFDLATRRASDTIEPVTMLSPVYYNSYANSYLKGYEKLGLTSAYLSDLGNVTVGDYSRTRITYAERGLQYQQQVLGNLQGRLDSVMMSAPYDYALKYVDFAVDVPVQSTLLGYYDYSIPFYQLVVSGLFDYAGPAVNYDSEHDSNWFLLKSLETGSNLQFMLTASDPKILLKTDYTMYYEAYYVNSKNDIIRMNTILDDIGIHESRLVSHRILRDDVFEVKYNNGLTIVINYTDTYYNDFNTGLTVKPNWFVVTKEAIND